MSVFERFQDLPVTEIWNGVSARLVESRHITMALVELAPGAAVPEHAHVNEQLGFVLSGSIEFTVDGETRECAPGDAWCILADVPHQARSGPDGAIVAEMYTPRREDWSVLPDAQPRAVRWPTG